MVTGSCHCGAVRLEVPSAPEWAARCNCSLCRRTGALMAYYPDDGSVRVTGDTVPYIWGDRMIALMHCPVCHCHTHWESIGESYGKVGVNARLLDGYSERGGVPMVEGRALELRPIDNADS